MNAASSSSPAISRPLPAPRPVLRELPRGAPAVGGLTAFSTVDWPGRLAAVVYIAGCPWRCHYCHNPELQMRTARYDWKQVRAFLESRRGLLDAVVFSGGEPLSEPRMPQLLRDVRRMGYAAGLHTAGIYPMRLGDALPMLDWVGLDIKADAAGYDDITGRRHSQRLVLDSLAQLLASGTSFECRITWSPEWLDETRLLALARQLARRGVRRFAVQNVRATPDSPPENRLGAQAHRILSGLFEGYACR